MVLDERAAGAERGRRQSRVLLRPPGRSPRGGVGGPPLRRVSIRSLNWPTGASQMNVQDASDTRASLNVGYHGQTNWSTQ